MLVCVATSHTAIIPPNSPTNAPWPFTRGNHSARMNTPSSDP